MAGKAYARRYAQAVFEIALETEHLDGWYSDLQKVVGGLEDATLMAYLESPKVPFEVKRQQLAQLFEGINPLVLNLVYVLISKGRLDSIGAIVDEYQRLLDSHRGIERGELVTAVPVDEKETNRFADYLGTVVGKQVVLRSVVDPSMIGGVIVKVGGKLLDGSTRNKLVALKKELAGIGK